MQRERTEVIALDDFSDWFMGLDDKDAEAVARLVDLLELRGVSLGRPYSGTITGSRHPMRELVVQSKGDPIRVFYAFDPKRNAVLLIGGHKAGKDRFYEVLVPRADGLFDAYLKEQGSGKF
jgi:hypothetical protein